MIVRRINPREGERHPEVRPAARRRGPAFEVSVREVIDRVADRWTMLIFATLRDLGCLRFTRLGDLTGGIIQKMFARWQRPGAVCTHHNRRPNEPTPEPVPPRTGQRERGRPARPQRPSPAAAHLPRPERHGGLAGARRAGQLLLPRDGHRHPALDARGARGGGRARPCRAGGRRGGARARPDLPGLSRGRADLRRWSGGPHLRRPEQRDAHLGRG